MFELQNDRFVRVLKSLISLSLRFTAFIHIIASFTAVVERVASTHLVDCSALELARFHEHHCLISPTNSPRWLKLESLFPLGSEKLVELETVLFICLNWTELTLDCTSLTGTRIHSIYKMKLSYFK